MNPAVTLFFSKVRCLKPSPARVERLRLWESPWLFIQRLTNIPIIIYYGDYIPRKPIDNP